eukprot:CAMPEP_0182812500 /NCGR_PEP_ID=MMETSP0006_2-20121128/8838_1 /TAXON_ID=97485 /ORGANISM="Prymnesium parvum, Strain Texoma1" /LENGTH=65 /DNA_ID=CAMNT_0024938531 /DNA_START=532 /DNA_END=729 /DNA_ORIENTATION=-
MQSGQTCLSVSPALLAGGVAPHVTSCMSGAAPPLRWKGKCSASFSALLKERQQWEHLCARESPFA